MNARYTKEDLIDKLQELYKKHCIPITNTMIDNEVNFPTRKSFKRLFGSWQNACKKADVPFNNKKHKFNINDAQEELDKRNGNFILLDFNSMRNKNQTLCKKCGYIWNVETDSLLDNNNDSKGCPNCYNILGKFSIYHKVKKFTNEHNLEFIDLITNNIYRVKCKNCNREFNLYKEKMNDNFMCKCETKSIPIKIKTNINVTKNKNKIIYVPQELRVDTKKYKLTKLLDESLQSYYILGFLFADGHFGDDYRIKLKLKKSDKIIIDKIAQYLEIENSIYEEKRSYGISCMDKYTSLVLKEKYDIKSNKTYIPCKINNIKGDKFMSFLIGFIDGDGCICNRSDTGAAHIKIKLHKSWEDNLNYMSKELYENCGILKFPKAIDVKQGENIYTSVTFGNAKVVKKLKEFIINNNIFCLDRKWNKIVLEDNNDILYK